jgi:MYXO-CTERM domain-containing protein
MIHRTALCAVFAALALLAGPAVAQDLEPLGAPQLDKTLRDPEFGVIARHLGLERQVEMLQWQASRNGYTKTWSTRPIDSSRFAPEYRNPGALPLRSRRWVAGAVFVDGKPLDPEVLRTLGEWHEFRPSFSALPGNLAATFQPEGNGLGSAENPLDPRIGDLRIHWRELVLPPLDDKVALKHGRWQLVASQPGSRASANAAPQEETDAPPHRATWLFGGAFVALVIAFAARRRRRNR